MITRSGGLAGVSEASGLPHKYDRYENYTSPHNVYDACAVRVKEGGVGVGAVSISSPAIRSSWAVCVPRPLTTPSSPPGPALPTHHATSLHTDRRASQLPLAPIQRLIPREATSAQVGIHHIFLPS